MMTILMINVKAMVSFKKTSPPPPPYDKDANYDYGNDFDYDHYDNDYDYHCNDYDYDYNYDYHDLLFPPPPVVLPPIQVDAPGNDLSLYHDQYVGADDDNDDVEYDNDDDDDRADDFAKLNLKRSLQPDNLLFCHLRSISRHH